jgi:hypothetical protein
VPRPVVETHGCPLCSHLAQPTVCSRSPSALTVNKPLLLLRLPTKNRAPCTDSVAGKGMSVTLKIAGDSFRATGQQGHVLFVYKRKGVRILSEKCAHTRSV